MRARTLLLRAPFGQLGSARSVATHLARRRRVEARVLLLRRSMALLPAPRLAAARLPARAWLCSNAGGAPPPAPPPARWTPAWAWKGLKETAVHYYHGSKLLVADVKIASRLFRMVLVGRTLTRREHNLLVRVCADIARLVPLSFFVIVPMMEFALPFALKLFPSLLPSTFEEKHHKEEKQKKLLKVRLEMASVFEHTLEERAHQVTQEERAKERKKQREIEEAEEAKRREAADSAQAGGAPGVTALAATKDSKVPPHVHTCTAHKARSNRWRALHLAIASRCGRALSPLRSSALVPGARVHAVAP